MTLKYRESLDIPTKTLITGSDGSPAVVDEYGGVKTITTAHQHVHEGRNFVAFHHDPDADTGSGQEATLLIYTLDTNKEYHALLNGFANKEVTYYFTENPTVVTTGNIVLNNNSNRNSSNSSTVNFYGGGLIQSGTGTILMTRPVGSTGGPFNQAATDRGTTEFILKRSGVYAFVAIPANDDTSIVLEVDGYEVDE